MSGQFEDLLDSPGAEWDPRVLVLQAQDTSTQYRLKGMHGGGTVPPTHELFTAYSALNSYIQHAWGAVRSSLANVALESRVALLEARLNTVERALLRGRDSSTTPAPLPSLDERRIQTLVQDAIVATAPTDIRGVFIASESGPSGPQMVITIRVHADSDAQFRDTRKAVAAAVGSILTGPELELITIRVRRDASSTPD